MRGMVIRMAFVPKLLLISNLQTTSPLWAFSTIQQRWNITLESHPDKATQRWAEILPDMIICDIDSGADSIAVITKLRFLAVLPILLLTSNHAERFLLEAYEAGADECILKPIHPLLFEAKIKAWLRHTSHVPVDVLDSLKVDDVEIIPADRALIFDDHDPIHLTNLELRLMYYFMGHPGRTLTTKDLCEHVWGVGSEVDATMLKNLIYRLRQKIEADSAYPRYVHTVIGVGYQFIAS
jgi:two-component system KDP operon response regulator KdpE